MAGEQLTDSIRTVRQLVCCVQLQAPQIFLTPNTAVKFNKVLLLKVSFIMEI